MNPAARTIAPRSLLAAALLAFAIFGCGTTDEETPTACLAGPGAYLRALEAAPGDVRLEGEAPISDCLPGNQEAGALTTVGASLVSAATRLNSEARAQPDSGAALELGYLIGAAERGAEDTEGIHAELLRRLGFAARFSPEGPLPADFMRDYRRGFDAGRAGG